MNLDIGWLNGSYVDRGELVVDVTDRGFTLADAAYDIARTYGGHPFRLERHLARFTRTLGYLGIDVAYSVDDLSEVCHGLLERNDEAVRGLGDVLVVMRATRGIATPLYTPVDEPNPPTVLAHLAPLPFENLARAHTHGMHLVTSSVLRTPASSIDPNMKTHARLNLVLANNEIAVHDPGALPVLYDADGHVTETFTSNILAVEDGALISPRPDGILPGITREAVFELATSAGIEVREQDITREALQACDEVFLTSTSYGIMPVGRLDGQPVGEHIPGPLTSQLIDLFAALVGVDPRRQVLDHSS